MREMPLAALSSFLFVRSERRVMWRWSWGVWLTPEEEFLYDSFVIDEKHKHGRRALNFATGA